MEEFDREMIQFPMSTLNKIGLLNSNQVSILKRLSVAIMLFLGLFTFVSTVIQYFYIKKDILAFIENSEAFAGNFQVTIKFWCFVLYKKKFLNLIRLSKQFWNTENCSDSLKKELYGVSRRIILFQKVFFYSILVLSPSLIIATFFGKDLPAGSWNMENQDTYYKFLYFSWTLVVPYYLALVTTFDGLFLGFCFEIRGQFLILGNSFENLSVNRIRNSEDFEVYYQQLRNNIQHHIFVLNFVKELQTTYSLSFMAQCSTIVPMICTEIYAFTESDKVALMIRCGFMCIAVIVQFSFYCISGSFVVDEASAVANGIYNSDWFSNSFPQLKMPIVSLIQASQKELKFTANGLIPININTLAKVIKVAFSANTVFKSLKE